MIKVSLHLVYMVVPCWGEVQAVLSFAGLRSCQEDTNHPTFRQLSITHSVLFHVVRIAKVLVKPLTTLRLRGLSGWVHPWSLTRIQALQQIFCRSELFKWFNLHYRPPLSCWATLHRNQHKRPILKTPSVRPRLFGAVPTRRGVFKIRVGFQGLDPEKLKALIFI